MRFARILQDLREDRDISRKDLALALNISVSTLGMYEQGRREPNIDMLIKMADYFDVSIDFLVGRSFKNENNELLVEALHLKNEIDKLPQGYKNIIDFMLNTKE
jgi:transcriptional regulator with XRE-family HTH domain